MAMPGRFAGFIYTFVTGIFCGCLFTVFYNENYRTPLPAAFQMQGHIQQTTDVFNSSADPKHCADASTSVMKLTNQKAEFQLGETILVTIQLFDSYKQRKTRGGDFVQVRMTEKDKTASAAGVVTDHSNGVYTGRLKALWTGSPQIEASVIGPRETMEIYYRVFRDHHTLGNISALFECQGVKEETWCLPTAHIPGFKHVCNLTAENYGLPWYCGRPSDRKLLCRDFVGLRNQYSEKFTDHEKHFFERQLQHQKLPEVIQVTVNPGNQETVGLPTIPCNKSPLRQSWEASTPVGFFHKDRWHSLTCMNTVSLDLQIYRECLKDRTLWLSGDSTSRQWFNVFQKRLGMDVDTEAWDPHTAPWDLASEPWTIYRGYYLSVLRDDNWNLTVNLVPHEYPFYSGPTFSKLQYNRAIHAYLDELPSHTRDIFVIHLYLHFNPFPPDVYRTHVRRIVKSVGSLLSRAPSVKIAVRGPHVFEGSEKRGFLDDIWMFVYDRILREEFKGYEDNILFLNNVDLTITTEIDDCHPNRIAVESLINHFMSYVCS